MADTPAPVTRYIVQADIDRIAREWGTNDPNESLKAHSREIAVRLEALDAPEHTVVYLGDGRLIIEIQGTDNRELVEKALGIPVDLQFRVVSDRGATKNAQKGMDMVPIADGSGAMPLLTSPSISGLDLVYAASILDPVLGEYAVELRFNDEGAASLERITRSHIGRRLALVFEGQIGGAPRILEPITTGQMQVKGGFSRDKANELAIKLQVGASISMFEIVEEQLVE